MTIQSGEQKKNRIRMLAAEFRRSPLRWPILLIIAGSFIAGWLISGSGSGHGTPPTKIGNNHDHAGDSESHPANPSQYTCSMHPQVKQPKPGKCPICFMDLIPVAAGDEADAHIPRLTLSKAAMELAEIQTARVERKFASASIFMTGKIEMDETRVKHITARVPGRIDRLWVDFTGISVREGDHLVSLFSPELISAQQELLQALQSSRNKLGDANLEAAKEKLSLWGLTSRQINNIVEKGVVSNHLVIYSPKSGVVIEKHSAEGSYVDTGSPLYTIADLSRLWVRLDAYEADLGWIRYGQRVTFEVEALPGERFDGRIAFINPVLDPASRTVKVRVNVENVGNKLKPEMFVRARVDSRLSVSGKVVEPELAGKWISPMHPEIIKNGPGKCDVCGMPLVRAETLGYAPEGENDADAPLVIPASAPLITGARAVVYIAVPGREGTFEGREIVLGPKAGPVYVVRSGLAENEMVVVNGAFKLDSDLQIQARPSMMNPAAPPNEPSASLNSPAPPGNKPDKDALHKEDKSLPSVPPEAVPPAFHAAIKRLAEAYFDLQFQLSGDNLEKTRGSARELAIRLEKIAFSSKILGPGALKTWNRLAGNMKQNLAPLLEAESLDAARAPFAPISETMRDLLKTFSTPNSSIWIFHCPMALDNKGAWWLQNSAEPRNPYFGASMLLCKDIAEPLFHGNKIQKAPR